MKRRLRMAVSVLAVILAPAFLFAGDSPARRGEIRKGIRAEGACAIVGVSAEQSQLTALQRARASAIEQAAGVAVASGTLVTNFSVAADFIKTYARGFIVGEKVEWLPLGQYQKDASQPPIPEYRVRIVADVYVPAKKRDAVGLAVKLNKTLFRSGEKAVLSLRARKDADVAIFNMAADDRVALIFPNSHESGNRIDAGKEFLYPERDSKVDLEMETLPGHERDAEAFFIIAWDRTRAIKIMDYFPAEEPIGFGEFFRKLSEIADYCEEAILPYEVAAGK